MKKVLPLIAVILVTFQLKAQDRVFTRTYQSNVLPLGAMELEYWNTLRSGKTHFYNAMDQRLELELGLGKKVQTAFYLNFGSVAYSPIDSFMVKDYSIGFSNEWKFKLSDPVANKIGSALYAEIGFEGDEIELEGKLILDKQIGKNIFAANIVGEYEIEYEAEDGEIETEVETPVELDLAYMHMIGKHAGLGLEVRNHNEIKEGEWEHSAWFAGPTLHFSGDRWFINLNVLPQLFNAKKEEGSTENLVLDEHEKVEARVLMSFAF
ncbi:MAG TPA: hypothetical protein PKL85_08050 [Bacteroidia bacterium]|nr:hypothetical protein [Bacteroidia bacterium]